MEPRPITKLYLLRHGEVEARYHRIFGGRIDMELSPRGHEQARALADYLADTHFHAVYCSPMQRARQTAVPLLAARSLEPVVVEELREIDFGVWTGLSWQEVAEKYHVNVFTWLDLIDQGKVPEAETGSDFRQRVEVSVKKILRDRKGETVAIVCHGGVVRAMLSVLLDLPLPLTGRFDIEYAGLTTLEIHDHKSEVTLLNLVPWRDLPVH